MRGLETRAKQSFALGNGRGEEETFGRAFRRGRETTAIKVFGLCNSLGFDEFQA
jgi:hypothetical protein